MTGLTHIIFGDESTCDDFYLEIMSESSIHGEK